MSSRIDERLKDLRGASRRDFIKWSGVLAAAIGLERSKYLDVLNDTAGSALADTAGQRATAFSIFWMEGNGGLSNLQLLFPQTRVATGNNPAYPFHAMGKAIKVQGTTKEMHVAPEMAPVLASAKTPFTAFLCGRNETHTGAPQSAANLGGAGSLLANAAAIQQKVPTLLPVITVGNIAFGTAAGAPAPAVVANAGGMVDLFNSNASKTLLSTPKNAGLSEAYYKAFLNLNAAAGRATMTRGQDIGKVSMNLLGKNLSDQLRPTQDDLKLFGLGTGVPNAIVNMGQATITALKAFRLGLSSGVVISGQRNDPHQMFANGDAQATLVAKSMADVLNGMFTMAKSLSDPGSTNKSILDSLVWAVYGDTTKSFTNRQGWPDGTAGGANMLIAYGAGYLKTGWFGNLSATADNQVDGWDPATGNTAPYNADMQGQTASAAVCYAIAKGDLRAVPTRNDMGGITNTVVI